MHSDNAAGFTLGGCRRPKLKLDGNLCSGGTQGSAIVGAVAAGISIGLPEYASVTIDALDNGEPTSMPRWSSPALIIVPVPVARREAPERSVDRTFTCLPAGDTMFNT
jgi:hypothetical protein